MNRTGTGKAAGRARTGGAEKGKAGARTPAKGTPAKGKPTRSRPARGRAGKARASKTPLVWLAVGAVVVVAAVVALAMGGGEQTAAADVQVDGQALPPMGEAGDPALGAAAAELHGTGVDGTPVSVEPGGEPMVVLFLAHWCPVCREEVPSVQGWLDGGNQPDGVGFVAVATGNDRNRPNHPPGDWLEGEGWTVPTLLDDARSSAGQAYGVDRFPYWVFLDADGAVVARYAGALPPASLESVMRDLADGAAGE